MTHNEKKINQQKQKTELVNHTVKMSIFKILKDSKESINTIRKQTEHIKTSE